MSRKIKVKYLQDINKPWNIAYAALKTEKFGDIQIGMLNNVICFLYFSPPNQLKSNVAVLMKRWKEANFKKDSEKMQTLADKIFSGDDNDDGDIEVVLCGTEFQNNVWNILLKIPKGDQWTYGDCAEEMGKPSAVRAVANAVANNEIAFLIPCHRVVSKKGNKFKYGWGAEKKKSLLDYEAQNKEK